MWCGDLPNHLRSTTLFVEMGAASTASINGMVIALDDLKVGRIPASETRASCAEL